MKTLKKARSWFCDNLLLIISIFIPVVLFVSAYCTHFDEWIERNFGLTFYYVFLIVGAILTIFWTNKRYKLGQRQYQQAEESIF